MAESQTRSFVERVEQGGDYVLEHITGQDKEGQPCYHVVLMPADQVEALRRDLAVKSVPLEHYGEVLASGEGHELPDGLIDELRGLVTKS